MLNSVTIPALPRPTYELESASPPPRVRAVPRRLRPWLASEDNIDDEHEVEEVVRHRDNYGRDDEQPTPIFTLPTNGNRGQHRILTLSSDSLPSNPLEALLLTTTVAAS